MASLKLLKNNELVMLVEGKREKEFFLFDNIIYDAGNSILIREDESFKYSLDFKNAMAIVTLKEKNSFVTLPINVTNIDENGTFHHIEYTIESDKENTNVLEVFFD